MNLKKTFKLLIAIIMLLVVLAGCAPASNRQSSSALSVRASGLNGQPITSSAPTVESKKNELTIGFSSIPSNYDPLNGFANGVQIMYSALVQTDANMNVVEDLATSYTISEDALTYTFTLREGALFSDGKQITPNDVVFSFKTAMGNVTDLDLSMIESVSADGFNISIKLKQARSTFILTVASVGIVSESAYSADFATNPICSGPYKLVQYDIDQQFILEANDKYYGNAPGIKRVIFIKMSDEDTRLIAVKSGQIDITLVSATIASSNNPEGYYLLSQASVDNFGISLPVLPSEGKLTEDGNPIGNNVTCDIAIRKALAYGIDRQKIVDESLNGHATPCYSENDGMPWSNPESAIEFDLDYSVKLLDDAGWKDSDGDGIREKNGLKASFPVLYFSGDSVRQSTAMSLSNQARDNLGIEIDVEGAGEDLSKRMFSEPIILAWGSSNPMTSYMLFHSSNAGKVDWYNPEFFQNSTVDKHLDAALGAKSIEEAIPYWKKAQWDSKTGTSMRGEAPYIFLINKDHLYYVRNGLDTGKQKIHAHGDAWPLVNNLRDWQWS